MASICLNMIVKNEVAVIDRCLVAVAPHIDYYVICDTGSDDGTPDRIRAVMDRFGVPGEIHQFEFRTFSQARNEALERARASTASFDYLLLLDADMALHVEDARFRERLTQPVYVIRQEAGISYYNPRLIGRHQRARYIGATHEYLDTGIDGQRLDGIWLEDYVDGANRAEKSERDIRLLSEELASDPTNKRTLFYLAQSYKDAGQPARAIEFYERRIAAGGWAQEVWYSRYMIAICHLRLGNEAEFVRQSLEAYNARPTRAEPLYHLAKHYRDTGKYDACLALCEVGATIPFPDDELFVEPGVYRRGFRSETSIAGFYSQLSERKTAGREACLWMSTDRAEAPHWRWRSLNNAVYYRRNAAEIFPGFREIGIDVATDPGFKPLNPSISIHDGRRYCLVRTSNFIPSGQIRPESGLSVVATRNVVVELDAAYRPIRISPVDESSVPGPVYPSRIVGFEDCRLIWRQGEPWLSSTSLERNPENRCEIVLLRLDDQWRVRSAHVQVSPEPELHQKNWMPFIRDDELWFVYKLEPLTIARLDETTMQVVVVSAAPSPLSLDLFRGGSQLIPIQGGWLAVAHEVAQPNRAGRVYLHRFVRFDESLRLAGLSEHFSLTGHDIEFCAGLARDPDTGELVLSYGVGDAEARLGFVDEATVLARIRPVGV